MKKALLRFIPDKLNRGLKRWGAVSSMVILFTGSILAQNSKTLAGTVTSPEGESLVGVSVSTKGGGSGATTDVNGRYTLTATSEDVLVFSYIGYNTAEVAVGGQSVIDVVLTESAQLLNDVVVVGYGSQKKSDLTGAVSVVDVEDAKKTVTYDVAKMLQGQVPGLTVQSSGEPGGFVNIKIRGITSFNNNNPLFVIDGLIVNDPYDFAPGDIESIQVLKDASASAIYGVRGANGVVIITTKKGQAGKLKVNYKTQMGIQQIPKTLSLANAREYQQITSQAELNAGLSIVPGNDPNSPLFISDVNTDWQDAAFRNGNIKNHSLNFSGGTNDVSYSMNVDYFDNTSYIDVPQAYERLSTNANLVGKKGRFSYGSKLAYTNSYKESFNEYFVGTTSFLQLLQAIPTMPVYDENRLGGFGGADNLTQRAITLNVIGFNNLIDNENRRNRFAGNIWGEVELLKGLKYKLRASADRLDWATRRFNPPSDLGWYYITTNDEAALDATRGNQTRTIVDNLLSYDNKFGKHSVGALFGYIQEINKHSNLITRGVGYLPGEISQIEYANAQSAREYNSTITGISYLSRLNYGYDDRYLLTVNFRQDKSSLFSPENNTGNYYSVAGAWKLHNESWLNLPGFINTLKLRGGYGLLGNNTIGVYDYVATVNPFAFYPFGDVYGTGITAIDIKDPNVKWEDTETANVAVEFGMLDNKLEFSAEYYQKKSTDLLADVPLPFSTGAFPATITTNAATVQNKGFEFAALYRNNFNGISYSIGANLGTLKNEVLSIGADNIPISGVGSRTEVGRSIGEIYVFEIEGIFQNADEIANHALQPNAAPGDLKFKDLNNDGLITDDDRSFQGVTIPKYSFGFNLSAEYKGFDLSCFLQGVAGNMVINNTYAQLMLGDYVNHHTDMLNYWTEDNRDTDVPRPVIGDPNGNNRLSNRFVEKGNYLRIQALELGYTLPLRTNLIRSARVSVSGQNLYTFTKYRGFDPDFISDGLFSRGFDSGSFPNPRGILFGLSIGF
ncbi:MAG: TonB-dependent receptor [Saprospiraceae bacterium]